MSDYKKFYIPKAKGGVRTIEAPCEKLKEEQKNILNKLEDNENFKPSYFTHSFMKGRNVVTAAKPHVGKKYLLKMDVSDFFGSIKLKTFLQQLMLVQDNTTWAYKGKLSTSPGYLTKNYDKEFLKEIGKKCFRGKIHKDLDRKMSADEAVELVYKGGWNNDWIDETWLPQGAPTSPYLSNVFMRRFDWMVAWFCARPSIENYKLDAVRYSRYADDLFFSSDDRWWLKKVKNYVEEQLNRLSLEINNDKGGLFKDGQRKQVCGVIVNEKLNAPREMRRKNRARKHQAQFDERGMDNIRQGKIAYQEMIEKQKERGFPENNIDVTRRLTVINNI